MGDDDHGDVQLLVDVPDQLQYLSGGLGVQGTGGLVAQQNLGVGGQGTGNGHALLLAAGQLGRIGVCLVRQANQLQQLAPALFRVGPLYTGDLHGEADVTQAGALHEQVEVLEDHSDVPASGAQLDGGHGVQPLAVHDDLALCGALQQVDAAHQRALARAGHTDNAVDVSILNGQGHILQCVHASVGTGVVCLAYVFQFYHDGVPRFCLIRAVSFLHPPRHGGSSGKETGRFTLSCFRGVPRPVQGGEHARGEEGKILLFYVTGRRCSARPAWSACRRTAPWAPRGWRRRRRCGCRSGH